jgi:hypothetical protein
MIKNFKRSDIQNTPFVATKPWVLTSFQNQDLVIVEEKPQEIPVAQEFIDYEGGDNLPILNRECNIALEQQDPDNILYEEGKKCNDTFYPETDLKNNTGTYQRLIYTQIKNSFYNEWNNPTKMFGMENIDFQTSGIKKFLSEQFRVFTISKDYFGEKMLENTILLVDNALDDNFQIVDDGKGNIIAKENLFSKVQEVRRFYNSINTTETSSVCTDYYTNIESRQSGVTGSYYGSASTSSYLYPDNCQPW